MPKTKTTTKTTTTMTSSSLLYSSSVPKPKPCTLWICFVLFLSLSLSYAPLSCVALESNGVGVDNNGDDDDRWAHRVDVTYTSAINETAIATLQGLETTRTIDNVKPLSPSETLYEFTNFPELGPPSGMKLQIDVTLETIRVEITTLPTNSLESFVERLYVYFDHTMTGVTLLTDSDANNLPPSFSYQLIPIETTLAYNDPQGAFGTIFPILFTGALEVKFSDTAALTTDTATESFTTTLEFGYTLDIEPTMAPTPIPPGPTFQPTSTFYPTLYLLAEGETWSPTMAPASASAAKTYSLSIFGMALSLVTLIGLLVC